MVAAPSTWNLEDGDAHHTEDEMAGEMQPVDEAICHFCGGRCGRFTRWNFLAPLVRPRTDRRLGRDG